MDAPKLKDKIKSIGPRLVEARKMQAVVLDLELGFFNEDYFQKENKKTLLNQTLIAIKNFAKSKGYENSIDWLNSWFIRQ